MREYLVQMLGLLFLVLPLMAVQWNLAGKRQRKVGRLGPQNQKRWRLEMYSNHIDPERDLADWADIPFPVKQVRSARGQLAQKQDGNAWALPRIEIEVDVDDPFSDESMIGIFGSDHYVRFVSGNEAMIETAGDRRIRVRSLPIT